MRSYDNYLPVSGEEKNLDGDYVDTKPKESIVRHSIRDIISVLLGYSECVV